MQEILKKLQEIETKIEKLQTSVNEISTVNMRNFEILDKRITDEILSARTEINQGIERIGRP